MNHKSQLKIRQILFSKIAATAIRNLGSVAVKVSTQDSDAHHEARQTIKRRHAQTSVPQLHLELRVPLVFSTR